MFVHLGESTVIKDSEIVAIIDLDNTTISKITKDFLRKAEDDGLIINVSEELPKSAVICEVKGKKKVYISQISPITLQKRVFL